MINTTAVIETRLGEYLAKLNSIAPEGYSFDIEQGRRYAKIVMSTGHGQKSVHAFVESATGAVLKAEGWSRPARGVRFSLSNDTSFERLLEALDGKSAWAGGYLYVR